MHWSGGAETFVRGAFGLAPGAFSQSENHSHQERYRSNDQWA
jgi:hypothetical protein